MVSRRRLRATPPGKRDWPVPPVRSPRVVSQPRDFVEIGNFAPFSEFLHIKGQKFLEFFLVQVYL